MSDLRTRAKELRHNPTPAEAAMWERLRARRLSGFKFVRQMPIGPFIADFVCRRFKVVVELDGEPHTFQTEQDKLRDEWFEARGFLVLHFWNKQVMLNTDNVCQIIEDALVSRVRHEFNQENQV